MDGELRGQDEPFQPLRPASRPRLILAIVFGPAAWLVALAAACVLVARTDAIEAGLAISLASFVVAAIVLALLRLGRAREERSYSDRA
jgi:membrane protein implicated in regulation of membrane protease activity